VKVLYKTFAYKAFNFYYNFFSPFLAPIQLFQQQYQLSDAIGIAIATIDAGDRLVFPKYSMVRSGGK
jgi:hypothetical protein